MILKEPKFNIGDVVKHRNDNEIEILILDIVYSYLTNIFTYSGCIGFDDERVFNEIELTEYE